MGFTRVLSNIATWGATDKVDKANRSYNRILSDYQESVKQLKQCNEEINSLNSQLLWYRNYFRLFRVRFKLRRLYKNKNLKQKLSPEGLDILTTLKRRNFPVAYKAFAYNPKNNNDIWKDADDTNVATAIAAGIFGPLGAIAAHDMANDTITEIRKKEQEIAAEIAKIKVAYTQAVQERENAKLMLMKLQSIKDVVEKI